MKNPCKTLMVYNKMLLKQVQSKLYAKKKPVAPDESARSRQNRAENELISV
ncbi:MAG: hypothetical protein PHS53_01385 [Candidatus Pacebacteria bacterium]|nr:hypothetical protein [Candidatus Paceibacterota bacterium]